MRICSLVPGATEVLFALGLGEQVVGVSHECDWPPEAAERPAVTASLVDTAELTSAEIDSAVVAATQDGKPLYAVDEETWAQIDPDVVIAQELCEVCAVTTDNLEEIVSAQAVEVEVVPYSPSTLDHVLASIVGLGVRFDAEGAADEITGGFRSRLDRVRAARIRGPIAIDGMGPTEGWQSYWKDVDQRRRSGSSWAAKTIPPLVA